MIFLHKEKGKDKTRSYLSKLEANCFCEDCLGVQQQSAFKSNSQLFDQPQYESQECKNYPYHCTFAALIYFCHVIYTWSWSRLIT